MSGDSLRPWHYVPQKPSVPDNVHRELLAWLSDGAIPYTYFPGKFTDLHIRWNIDTDIPLFKPRYNIAPSQEAPVIVESNGKRSIEFFQ